VRWRGGLWVARVGGVLGAFPGVSRGLRELGGRDSRGLGGGRVPDLGVVTGALDPMCATRSVAISDETRVKAVRCRLGADHRSDRPSSCGNRGQGQDRPVAPAPSELMRKGGRVGARRAGRTRAVRAFRRQPLRQFAGGQVSRVELG
jgi:hypothetical protein